MTIATMIGDSIAIQFSVMRRSQILLREVLVFNCNTIHPNTLQYIVIQIHRAGIPHWIVIQRNPVPSWGMVRDQPSVFWSSEFAKKSFITQEDF